MVEVGKLGKNVETDEKRVMLSQYAADKTNKITDKTLDAVNNIQTTIQHLKHDLTTMVK